ncbi:MAG TPA: hypothetical protein VN625_11085 [Desulfuromonadaceae bacterium]|nr:hypothetical protein [Desulfuromonadaceae bacterium]
MSMINDALKRAQESQATGPAGGPPPLPPVMPPPKGGANPAWIIIIALIVISGAVVAFLLTQRLVKKATAPAPPPRITNTPPVVPVVTNLPPPPKTNPPAPVEVEPWPKIQGILYDSVHPTAILNKKTVGIGDRLGNFKVTAISHDSVTLLHTNGISREIFFGK